MVRTCRLGGSAPYTAEVAEERFAAVLEAAPEEGR
jgi:hypothetical protein